VGSSTSSEASSSPPERAWQRAVQIASARPCWTIAALGALLAVGNQWWVRRNRFLGATDADEAGYLATALRFQRSALDGPGVLWDRITESTSGPLVPLLSLPFTHLDGRNVWGAQAIQPVLHVIAAVAVTGITVRLAHRRAGLLAGVLALALPTALVAARSYQFNLGASAFLLGAVWALLASDRGRRPWPMAAMGLCAAAMTMSRTMTVGYLPALALGAAIGIRWDRRGLRSAGIAAGAFLLAAGPWWLTSWDGATAYLRRNGSSEFSEYWGPADVAGRVVERLGRLLVDLRIPLLLLGTVVVVLGLVSARRHPRSCCTDGTSRWWPPSSWVATPAC
jgi:4-amino-4-deoxy-L-arabinose transferase-like glycosyltransferase